MFYAAFNSISVISQWQLTLFMFFLSFTTTRLGTEVSCPRTLPRINPGDLVGPEPRTPGLQVKHLSTEPRGTLKMLISNITFSCYVVYPLSLFTKQQIFGLDQVESICRRQNKWDSKIEIWFRKGRKNCGKMRKCWLPAFSPFNAMFSESSYTWSLKVMIVW